MEASIRLDSLLKEHWNLVLKVDPLKASSLGDRRFNREWPDLSAERYVREQANLKSIRDRVKQISVTQLDAERRLNRDVLLFTINGRIEQIAGSDAMMTSDHQVGHHVVVQDVIPLLPFASRNDYSDYITRLESMPLYLAQATNLLQIGLSRGLAQPKVIVRRSIEQCEEVASLADDQSPFAEPLSRFPAGISTAERDAIRKKVLAAIANNVAPAFREYARFLREAYLPSAPAKPGLWVLRDGAVRYRRALRIHTTSDLSPDRIHEIGLAEVARIRKSMVALSRQMGFRSIEECKKELLESPKYRAKSAAELLRINKGYIDGVKPHLPRLFIRLPKAMLEVRPIPGTSLKGDIGYYDSPAPDGARPGIYWVAAGNYKSLPLLALQAIAVHEAAPGHHMQISIAQEMDDLPEVRQHADFNAYIEGWGLYAERIVDELGLFKDPVSLMGRLSQEMYRACRLVVDTGLHAKRWSRQRAVDYLMRYTFSPRQNIESEVDRYIAWPGQATSYKIGELEIVRLRELCRRRDRKRFDIRKFHDKVLMHGPLPLKLLERQILTK